MSTQLPQNQTKYQLLPPPIDTTNTSEQFNSDTNNQFLITNRKKQKQGCCCCTTLLIGFLLCFFLIPRPAHIFLQNIIISSSGDIFGNFQFKNNNFYNIKWYKPDISLYWIPYNGQQVGQICYDNISQCDSKLYYDNMCAIKLGEFKSNINFNTKALSQKNKQIELINSTSQQIACTSWMILNPYQNKEQRLISNGHIYINSDIFMKKKIKVPDEYYYI